MKSFPEFESTFLDALQQERSDLQGLQGASEAQLSAWIEHLFQEYLGYSYKDFSRGEGMHIGAKGGKQLYTDLRIDILDNGLIFIECKRMGRLDSPEELKGAAGQLHSYIQAHLFEATTKPKTVLGVVTDGNRWVLMGFNKTHDFDTIAEWTFLTDDPRLIAQRLWLLAKPALAQPTSAVVEFLARRTLAEVLKKETKKLTKKVNDGLPDDGIISEALIAKWLRDAFSDPSTPPRLVPADSTTATGTEVGNDESERKRLRRSRVDIGVTLPDLIAAGLLTPPLKLFRKYKGQMVEATLLPDGKVEFRGVQYDTCSAAAEAARQAVVGRRMNTNGWDFWQYRDAAGKRLCLDDARKRLVKTKTGQHEQPDRQEPPEGEGLRLKFWQALLSRPKAKGTRHADIKPGEYVSIGAGSGVRGVPFSYAIGQHEGRVELFIDRGAEEGKQANKRIFDRLQEHKGEIEGAFGGALSWQPLEGKRACRIAYATTAGGYRSDEPKWPEIQDSMIEAMMRLEKALIPHLAKLQTELAS